MEHGAKQRGTAEKSGASDAASSDRLHVGPTRRVRDLLIRDPEFLESLQSVLNTLPSGDPLRRFLRKSYRFTFPDVVSLVIEHGKGPVLEELRKRGLCVTEPTPGAAQGAQRTAARRT